MSFALQIHNLKNLHIQAIDDFKAFKLILFSKFTLQSRFQVLFPRS